MSVIEPDGMDVPMHEAPLERQASVAAAEAELLVNAFEGSVPVPPSKAVAAMRAEGVVQMDGVMNCTTARALRAHVCARLQEIQSGDESPPVPRLRASPRPDHVPPHAVGSQA